MDKNWKEEAEQAISDILGNEEYFKYDDRTNPENSTVIYNFEKVSEEIIKWIENNIIGQAVLPISDEEKLQAAKDVVNNSVLHGNGGEIGIWLRSQISFLEQIEGKVTKVADYAGGLSIQFENGNKYGLKISKLSQVTLD